MQTSGEVWCGGCEAQRRLLREGELRKDFIIESILKLSKILWNEGHSRKRERCE